jgi:hypothetical protein
MGYALLWAPRPWRRRLARPARGHARPALEGTCIRPARGPRQGGFMNRRDVLDRSETHPGRARFRALANRGRGRACPRSSPSARWCSPPRARGSISRTTRRYAAGSLERAGEVGHPGRGRRGGLAAATGAWRLQGGPALRLRVRGRTAPGGHRASGPLRLSGAGLLGRGGALRARVHRAGRGPRCTWGRCSSSACARVSRPGQGHAQHGPVCPHRAEIPWLPRIWAVSPPRLVCPWTGPCRGPGPVGRPTPSSATSASSQLPSPAGPRAPCRPAPGERRALKALVSNSARARPRRSPGPPPAPRRRHRCAGRCPGAGRRRRPAVPRPRVSR